MLCSYSSYFCKDICIIRRAFYPYPERMGAKGKLLLCKEVKGELKGH